MYIKESVNIGGKELSIETGKMAKQADGSVVVRYGDTMVLVTAVANKSAREGVDFLPLTVEYTEKTAAAGKIPGGYFKREGRPTEREILTCRLIDRPSRPLFPKMWRNETQVIAHRALVRQGEPVGRAGDDRRLVRAAHLGHPVGRSVRRGARRPRRRRRGHKFIVNPTFAERESVGPRPRRRARRATPSCMVEGGAAQLSEDVMIDALLFAHQSAQPLLDLIEKIRAAVGKPKREFIAAGQGPEHRGARQGDRRSSKLKCGRCRSREQARAPRRIGALVETTRSVARVLQAAASSDADATPARTKEIAAAFGDLHKKIVREMVVDEGVRIDGRKHHRHPPDQLRGRPPAAHARLGAVHARRDPGAGRRPRSAPRRTCSASTRSLGDVTKRFMLHYNFPPFSTGEAKMMRSASRREIGHGDLAERALARVLPAYEDFPYTIRIVSETLESNGSSSMAAVCGGSWR